MKEDIKILENCAIRECCERFGAKMSAKLIQNNRGLAWRKESVEWLLERLSEEFTELDLAIQFAGEDERIIGECIDVAAFAIMIQDVVEQTNVDSAKQDMEDV